NRKAPFSVFNGETWFSVFHGLKWSRDTACYDRSVACQPLQHVRSCDHRAVSGSDDRGGADCSAKSEELRPVSACPTSAADLGDGTGFRGGELRRTGSGGDCDGKREVWRLGAGFLLDRCHPGDGFSGADDDAYLRAERRDD